MRTIRTVAEMRAWLGNARAEQRTVGLVPTMGAFHAGHHSLMRAARERCDEVVVSLFVNPTQFNEAADLEAYPRDEARDAAEAAELGVDVLYAPPVEEVYPPGFAPSVRVDGLPDVLECAERGPRHFAGGCTKIGTTTWSRSARARRISESWPSCSAPIVGTRPTFRPEARASSDDAGVSAV